MPRRPRRSVGGVVYHALNRANARAAIFLSDGDYLAFEAVLAQAKARVPGVALLDYVLMPNHWHLLLLPSADGQLSAFMGWLTMTHTQRWHAFHRTVGTGHLYQGRFKGFPVQDDAHILAVARYAERNPLRARLVGRAEDWRWSGLWLRERGTPQQRALLLDEWPVERPADWLERVNTPQTPAEEAAVRESVRRGRPFGDDAWRRATAARLGLESTFRQPGRPRKNARDPE